MPALCNRSTTLGYEEIRLQRTAKRMKVGLVASSISSNHAAEMNAGEGDDRCAAPIIAPGKNQSHASIRRIDPNTNYHVDISVEQENRVQGATRYGMDN